MKYISKSKMVCYDTCPHKYFIRYIEKIKLPTLARPLVVGIDAHRNLENYVKKIDLNLVKENPREGVETAMFQGLMDHQKELLTGFKELEIQRASKCIKMDKPLEKYFLPKHTELKIRSDKLGIVGVIDRVDTLFNDTIGIFDYKTGNKKEISKWNELELMTYYMLYKDKYPTEDVATSGIIYVSHMNPFKRLIPTPSLEAKIKTYIDNIRESIELDLFAVPDDPMYCPCEYADYCTKFGGSL